MRTLLALVLTAAGAARADAPVLVYVNDVAAADAALAGDAAALTSALCAALAKDKRVDVLCAPDVKQLLAFAASSSMLGASNPATESLQRRIDGTRFVVSARLATDKGATTLTTAIGVKDGGADLGAMSASTPLKVEEDTVSTRAMTMLERVPRVARRLVDAALAPTSLSSPASAQMEFTPPPSPLPTTAAAPSKKP